MSIAIRQDAVGNVYCGALIIRLNGEEKRPNIRVRCSQQCGTEYVVYYDPVMDVAEAQRVTADRVNSGHPDHRELVIVIDEAMPEEVRPLFRQSLVESTRKEELEQLPTAQLAVLCHKVGEDPRVDRKRAQEGRQLRGEWTLLQTPPERMLQEEKDKRAKQAALRIRMIEFLS